MSELLNPQFWAFVGVIAGIYTIFALGLQVQFGFTGLFNFGHVGFMALGAYGMAILIVKVGWPIWLASVGGIVVAILFGLLLGLPTLRLRADYLAITTISFGEIVRYVATNEDQLTGGTQGTHNLAGAGEAATYNAQWNEFAGTVQDRLEPAFELVGLDASRDLTMMVLVWVVALALLVFAQRIVRSPWGRVLRAVREDEDAAEALGKNVFAYKLQALAIGAALAGIAGMFFAFQFSFFSPTDFEPLTTFFAFVIVIMGGIARNWGVPLGAIIFAVIFAGTRFLDFPPLNLLDSADRAYVRLVIIGLILIALMVWRPQGIMGKREEMVLE